MLTTRPIKKILRSRVYAAALLTLCLTACSPAKPKYTYCRENIESSLVNICVKEFSVKPVVRETGDTIWVYVPVSKLLTEKNTFDEEANKRMRQIFTALKRVILSMENRPKSYSFIFSDIKNGVDLYYMGMVIDMMKVDTGMISLSQWQEREIFNVLPSPEAIGDTQAKHITMQEIGMGTFLAALVKQNLERSLSTKEMSKDFRINDLYAYYADGRLSIFADITKINKAAAALIVKDEAKKLIRKFLKIYDVPEIESFEISDVANDDEVFYSRKALLEDE